MILNTNYAASDRIRFARVLELKQQKFVRVILQIRFHLRLVYSLRFPVGHDTRCYPLLTMITEVCEVQPLTSKKVGKTLKEPLIKGLTQLTHYLVAQEEPPFNCFE